jgi:N-acetylglutamate synthase-like GNAT family acetyltransferase
MIRFSDKSKKDTQQLRQLWKECFGDSEAFMDYYFRLVFPENPVVVLEEREQIIGMVHLNPYNFQVEERQVKTYFIVGVAVREDYRRQGKMTEMLEYAFRWMQEEGIPFTYLWPADTRYYTKLGFQEATCLEKCCLSLEELTRLTEQMKAGGAKQEDSGCKKEEGTPDPSAIERESWYMPVYTEAEQKRFQAEAESEGGSFYVIQQENCYGCFSVIPYEGTLEVNHICAAGNLECFGAELLSCLNLYLQRYNREEEHKLKQLRISMDQRLWQQSGWARKLPSRETPDHIYMTKWLDDSWKINSQKFLFTEIV